MASMTHALFRIKLTRARNIVNKAEAQITGVLWCVRPPASEENFSKVTICLHGKTFLIFVALLYICSVQAGVRGAGYWILLHI